jgi:hypothetical protein
VTIPVEAWEKSGTMTWTGEKAVASATIDPEHVLPDDNRADNTLDAGH